MSVATGTLSNLIKKQSLKDSPVTVGTPIAKSAGGGTGFLSSIYRGVDGNTGKQLIDAGGRGIQVSHLESESYGGIPSVGPLMTAASWRHVPRNVIPNGHMIMKHNQPNIGPFVSTQRLDPPTATLVYNDFDSTITDRQLNVHPDGGRIKSPIPNLENAAQLGQLDLEIARLQQLLGRLPPDGVIEDETRHKWDKSELMDGIETLQSAKNHLQPNAFGPRGAIGDGGGNDQQAFQSKTKGITATVDKEMYKTQQGFMGMIKKVFAMMDSFQKSGLKQSFEMPAIDQLKSSIEALTDQLQLQSDSSGINMDEFTDVLKTLHTQVHDIMVIAKEDQRVFKEEMKQIFDAFTARISTPKPDSPTVVSPEVKADSPLDVASSADATSSSPIASEAIASDELDEKDPSLKCAPMSHTALRGAVEALQVDIAKIRSRKGDSATGLELERIFHEVGGIPADALARIPARDQMQAGDKSILIPSAIMKDIHLYVSDVRYRLGELSAQEIQPDSRANGMIAQATVKTQLELAETKEEVRDLRVKLEQMREVEMKSPESSPSPIIGFLPPTGDILPVVEEAAPVEIPAPKEVSPPPTEVVATPSVVEASPLPDLSLADTHVTAADRYKYLYERDREMVVHTYDVETGKGKRFIAVGDAVLARKLLLESDFGVRLAKAFISDFESPWMGVDGRGDVEVTPFGAEDISFVLDSLANSSKVDLMDDRYSAIKWSIEDNMIPFLNEIAIRAETRGPALGARGMLSAFEKHSRGDKTRLGHWAALAIQALRDAHQADIASKVDGKYSSDRYLQRFSTMVKRVNLNASDAMGAFYPDLGHFISHFTTDDDRIVQGFNAKPIATGGPYLNIEGRASFTEVTGGSTTNPYMKYSGDSLEVAKMRFYDIAKIGGGSRSMVGRIHDAIIATDEKDPRSLEVLGDFPKLFIEYSNKLLTLDKDAPKDLMDLSMEEASSIMDLSNVITAAYGIGDFDTVRGLEEIIGKLWLHYQKDLIPKCDGDRYKAFRGFLVNMVMEYDSRIFPTGRKFFDAMDYTSSAEYRRLLALESLLKQDMFASLRQWKAMLNDGLRSLGPMHARFDIYDKYALRDRDGEVDKRKERREKFNLSKK